MNLAARVVLAFNLWAATAVWVSAQVIAPVSSVARGDPRPGVSPDTNIVGTTWSGQDGEYQTTFRFEADGKLNYGYKNGHFDNGTWKQTGNTIYFEMNDKYREFKGTFEGDKIEGDSWNVAGKKWTTSITRKEK